MRCSLSLADHGRPLFADMSPGPRADEFSICLQTPEHGSFIRSEVRGPPKLVGPFKTPSGGLKYSRRCSGTSGNESRFLKVWRAGHIDGAASARLPPGAGAAFLWCGLRERDHGIE